MRSRAKPDSGKRLKPKIKDVALAGARATHPERAVHKPTVSPKIRVRLTPRALTSYMRYFSASSLERIAFIKQGIPAVEAKRLFVDLPIGQAAGFKALNLSVATVNKKANSRKNLSPAESERVIGCARLVGQVQAMVEESGDLEGFDAAAWMARWLLDPLPAFGGLRPADLMDTMEGQAMVSAALARTQSGAYA